ncbi:MAG: DUF3710 domain-containing protein [Bifidobacterium sp.]|jgi:hypothetical protein|nr:DUF3710 domain-containing protein [Bifidobacterium sp.]MCH4174630.1 DUF3710 domain-containing protein [Bifidobacterium sp.]
MGLFGFGKQRSKHHEGEDDAAAGESEAKDNSVTSAEDATDKSSDSANQVQEADELDDSETSSNESLDDDLASDTNDDDEDSLYEGQRYDGPWDIEDDDVIDYSNHLDVGAFKLPYLQGVELRLKANRANGQILGATITYGSSSLELEAFAAPKTLGLWDDVRADLLEANSDADEQEGAFGTEILLPVTVKGKRLITRVVGVDGHRWMLRGIFSGKAAAEGDEKDILDQFFSDVVVERGEEPLAPHDLLPMHPPITPGQDDDASDDDAQDDSSESSKSAAKKIPGKPDGPFDSDQQTEVKSTLSRGPMFSEMR